MPEYPITNVAELQAIFPGHLNDDCILLNDIDATGVAFVPVGTAAQRFTGTFDGQNHQITNLSINRPALDYVGLFGSIASAGLKDVTLVNANITGKNQVGALVGRAFQNCPITNCHSSGSVTGEYSVGGLIGVAQGEAGLFPVTIECSSTANVSFTANNNYNFGGLIGANRGHSEVYRSKSYGTVTGVNNVGGLVGHNDDYAKLYDCYSHSPVNGDDCVGGLIGECDDYGASVRCYSMGAVTGNTNVGGMTGCYEGITCSSVQCYWDTQTSGQAASAGPEIGKTTEEMQQQSTFYNPPGLTWDFNTIWDICEAPYVPTYPFLQWQGILCQHYLSAPTDLLCEQKTNPTDVADPKPEFSAIFHGG